MDYGHNTANRPTPQLTVRAIAGSFLRLGAQGFGGLGAVTALITRDLVERRGWLREDDITEALTYTKLLPGSTVVQVVAYLGWRLRGLPGTFAATGAFLLPSFLVMLGLAAGYRAIKPPAGAPAALMGLMAAVVGLLVVTGWGLGRKNIVGLGGLVIALLTFAASVRYGINPAVLVIVAGMLGVAREVAGKRP